MFLASCSLTCAGNIVKLVEKDDVNEYATQRLCFIAPARGEMALRASLVQICNAGRCELVDTSDTSA